MPNLNYRFLLSFSAIIFLAVLSLIYGNGIYADFEDNAGKIKFPVAELGGCRDAGDCRAFCDRDENIPRCIDFSVKNGLLSARDAKNAELLLARLDKTGLPGKCKNAPECFAYCESVRTTKECLEYAEQYGLIPAGETAETVRKFARMVEEGVEFPGGCASREECREYCEDIAHIEVCVAFAEKTDVMPAEELEEAKRVRAAVKSGVKFPGNCKSKNECEQYCENTAHMEECIAFAEKTGMISGEELAMAKKFLPLIRSGKTPGGCARKEQCETYCEEPEHMDECLSFAEKNGLIPPEELADARKFIPYMKRGETPGGCRRKEECEAYCSQEGNFEECIAFALKIGAMSEEDASLARETKGKGPGGCTSKEACMEFCFKPENRETCANFAREHKLGSSMGGMEGDIRGEVEKTMRECAQKPCGEFFACLRQFNMGPAPGTAPAGEDEGLPDDIEARMLACNQERMTSCLARSGCEDFISCLRSLGDGGGEEGEHEGAEQMPPEIQTRLNSCMAEMQTRAMDGAGGGTAPQTSEFQQQFDQQYQQQYGEEYQRQYEEQTRPQLNCALFELAPTCDFAGPAGSQTYEYCKMCFPNK